MLLKASSREMLKLVEGVGLSGGWTWTFETGEHAWSPGMHRLLGLSGDVRPDFSLLHRHIHPDDRHLVPTPAQVAMDGFAAERRLRILRADNTLRSVESRSETYHSPSGRPLRAMGVLVDVSDREAILRVQAAQRRRGRVLFERVGAFTSTTNVYPFRDFSEEWVELVGRPKAVLLADPVLPIVEEERSRWSDVGHRSYAAGDVVHLSPNLVLARGEVVRYRIVAVPLHDADGSLEGWSNYVAPLHLGLDPPPEMVEALDRRVEGRHVRAARALLDWSLSDLAEASGLSLSTMRRLEDGAHRPSARSLRIIVSTLRRHGIRFSLLEDATIALGKA